VLPPKVSPVEVVIVPISKGEGEEHDLIMSKVKELVKVMKGRVRVKVDERFEMRPGAKYFEWERKGVPLRLEIGPKDLANDSVMIAFRHNGVKKQLKAETSSFAATIKSELDTMQSELFATAKKRLYEKVFSVDSYAQMKVHINFSLSNPLSQLRFAGND
jgi:prolyl-tRNA synthetase